MHKYNDLSKEKYTKLLVRILECHKHSENKKAILQKVKDEFNKLISSSEEIKKLIRFIES
ncbi:MAG: hypothetical protein ACTSRP_27775 [Candidatus Helarchaeota archaeon]